ncbi:uncharacterized protein BO72DRAFT_265510 [Aspergillus fijiensis CBS 313.89]|uniref:Uncharacterized protein n=1 Tax=Aspergillus fijiensis CBS 313.89 TaxID=1448319 RepID=A0A8G1S0B9_9EURO|nr:uncharacterized protein BO72DRAFT_265510 [Aspergillus fijiensis CBS 313.89]RAK80966.1 hypothetical protein BO72DRAFT_265510 [Aspergillus fijiensis CBS 313.89]
MHAFIIDYRIKDSADFWLLTNSQHLVTNRSSAALTASGLYLVINRPDEAFNLPLPPSLSLWGVPSELRPSAGQLGQGGSRKHARRLISGGNSSPFGLPDLHILMPYCACSIEILGGFVLEGSNLSTDQLSDPSLCLPALANKVTQNNRRRRKTQGTSQAPLTDFAMAMDHPVFHGGVPHGNTGTLTGHPGLDVHRPLGPGAQTQQRQHSDLKQNTSNVEDDALSRRRRLVIMHAYSKTALCEEGDRILSKDSYFLLKPLTSFPLLLPAPRTGRSMIDMRYVCREQWYESGGPQATAQYPISAQVANVRM